MWREGEHLPSAGELGAKLGCRPGWSGPRPMLTAEFLNTDQSQEDFRLHQLYCQFIMMHRLCTEIHDIFQVLYLCFTGSNLCTSSWMNISVTQYQAQMGTQPHIWVDLMGALLSPRMRRDVDTFWTGQWWPLKLPYPDAFANLPNLKMP